MRAAAAGDLAPGLAWDLLIIAPRRGVRAARFKPGCYAISVTGHVNKVMQDELYTAGIPYFSRDTSIEK